jgi:DNA modification methylase
MPDDLQLIHGDARRLPLADNSVQCVVTSPPYWGLRKYAGEQELDWGDWRGAYGLEPTIEMYVTHSCVILRELWRVLRPDGVIFWNIGDSYASGSRGEYKKSRVVSGKSMSYGQNQDMMGSAPNRLPQHGLKDKDLCLIPERIALAAQGMGFWVRSRILWCKPNPMPESVTDRPTDAAEHIWMFTKSAKYFWDADAVREPQVTPPNDTAAHRFGASGGKAEIAYGNLVSGKKWEPSGGRNLRNVWTFATQPYPDAHFATFPEELPRRCIQAATSEKGACAQCGAPWVRVTDRDVHFEGGSGAAMTRDPESWKGSKFDGARDLEIHPNTQRRGGLTSWRGDRTVPDKTRPHAGWHQSGSGRHAPKDMRLPVAKGAGGEQIESGEYDIRMGPVIDSRTIGWRPGCLCRGQHGRRVPCLVLDPFGGSGTTGKVAIELGRRAVLVDIAYSDTEAETGEASKNVDGYLGLAEKRTRNVQRPLL